MNKEPAFRRLTYSSPMTRALKHLRAVGGYMPRWGFYQLMAAFSTPHTRSNALRRMQEAGYIEITVELTKAGEKALASLDAREARRHARNAA